jgi:outer membrane protein
MRLYQQFRASIVRSAVAGAGVLLFASGMTVSAFGQAAPAQPAAQVSSPAAQAPPAAPTGTTISIEEAARMALENNLNVQVEKLNPQIQVLGVSRANAAYAPLFTSSVNRSSGTAPPQDFNTSAGTSVTTNSNFRTSGGLAQNLRRFGSNYALSFDGTRSTSNNVNNFFNPNLGAGLNAQFNQPLLRNFKIDQLRAALIQSRNQVSIADLQLQQRITQTARNARAAYYALVGSIAGLKVAQGSLDVARTSLKNNQTRVEVGTMAPIDITAAEAEVASNEEQVIIQQAAIESAQDNLRATIMNPSQPDFWSTRFVPNEPPVATARVIDVDAAIKTALAQRTDLQQFKKGMENTDIDLKLAQNQKLPNIDLNARYGLTGVAGTQFDLDNSTFPPTVNSTSQRSFAQALKDVFGNDFKTWSVSVNVSYPIGTSQAEAFYAQAKLQKQQEQTQLAGLELQVTQGVRDAARQVSTNLKRVEATKRARELAQKRLDADNKRFEVGLATTFELLQSQRDLARAQQNELRATIDYNLSLVDFEAVQIAPIR